MPNAVRRAAVRRVVRIAAATAFVAGLTSAPRDARAMNCNEDPCDIFIPFLIVGAVGVGTLVGVDLYEAGLDVDEAWTGRLPTSGRSHFEVAWGASQAWIGPAMALAAAVWPPTSEDDWEQPFGTLLASTLPLALTMHGAWGANAARGDTFSAWILPLAAADAVPLAFDAWQTVRGARPGPVYAAIEIGAGSLQLSYGIAVAHSAASENVGAALAWSAVPTLLLAHGSYALAGGRRAAPEKRTTTSWMLAPLVVPAGPAAASRGIAVVGRF